VGAVEESERSDASLLAAAVAVLVTVIVVRALFVFGLEVVRRAPRPGRAGWQQPARPPWTYQVVISWTGMRGVVTLAVAAALPTTVDGQPFPDREALQFLAFAVTIGTLLLQGLTLPGLIRRLGVRDLHQPQRDAEEELRLHERATEAALQRVDELVTELSPKLGEDRLRSWADRVRAPLLSRTRTMTQAVRADEEDEAERGRRRARRFFWMRQEVLAIQRRVLMEERDKGHVDEEVVRAVLQELDYEEAATRNTWVNRL